MIDNYPVPVRDPDSNQEVCNRCGCAWEIELMGEPNRKQEWCKEVDRLPAACYCHDEKFAADFLQRMDRLAIAAETVIGYIDPSGKGEGNWVTIEQPDRGTSGLVEQGSASRSDRRGPNAFSSPAPFAGPESEWQKLRDLGYDETELRAAGGDR